MAFLTCLEVEPGLEAGPGPGPGVEEEDEPGPGCLDPLGDGLAAELEVVAVVLVVLLLAADVGLHGGEAEEVVVNPLVDSCVRYPEQVS